MDVVKKPKKRAFSVLRIKYLIEPLRMKERSPSELKRICLLKIKKTSEQSPNPLNVNRRIDFNKHQLRDITNELTRSKKLELNKSCCERIEHSKITRQLFIKKKVLEGGVRTKNNKLKQDFDNAKGIKRYLMKI